MDTFQPNCLFSGSAVSTKSIEPATADGRVGERHITAITPQSLDACHQKTNEQGGGIRRAR